HEVRRDGRAARPGLEHLLLVLLVQGRDLHEERRLHVRPLLDRASHYCVAFPRLRPRTISFVDGFFLCRVFFPSTLPHGFVGGRPPVLFPLPPPSGFLSALIVTTLTRGLLSILPLFPVFPIDCISFMRFSISPIVPWHC